MAYDLVEPIDPAGAILKGFGGSSGKPAPDPASVPASTGGQHWMAQKQAMIEHGKVVGAKVRKRGK